MGMTRFSSKWILSHSTWYKNGRSRQSGVLHHPVEFRSSGSGPAESVIHVLLHNLKPTLAGELLKIVELILGMLLNGADADVKCGSFHLLASSFTNGFQSIRMYVLA